MFRVPRSAFRVQTTPNSKLQTPNYLTAFSLIEILVAVALLAVIMLGLLAMFYQTQRAMRAGSTQVDVLETGRAVMQLLTDDLKQTVASGQDFTNLEAITTYPTLVQPRDFGDEPHTNHLQELFFINRENDQWFGTGYFVAAPPNGGAGPLYRFSQPVDVTRSNALQFVYDMFRKANDANTPRLADRIIHLQLRAYDTNGLELPFGNNLPVTDFSFVSNDLPAYLDVQLGIVEPKAYERYRAKTNNAAEATNYLAKQIDRVHLFRQRIPIRTVRTIPLLP